MQSRYQSEFNDTKYRVYSGTLNWDLGPASLESVTSFGTFESDFHTDLAIATNLTGGPPLASLVTQLVGNAQTRPLSAILPQTTSTDKITQELRLVSRKSESFEWLAGGYYTDEDSAIKQQILAVEAGTDDVAAGVPILADLALDSKYEEFAGLRQLHLARHVSPRSRGGRARQSQQAGRIPALRRAPGRGIDPLSTTSSRRRAHSPIPSRRVSSWGRARRSTGASPPASGRAAPTSFRRRPRRTFRGNTTRTA